MNFKDLTLENIKDYFQGNYGFFKAKLGLQPKYIQEQVLYRASFCSNECITNDSCKYCGCDRIPKLFVKVSCNKETNLPDLMEETDWNTFKIENNVNLDFQLP